MFGIINFEAFIVAGILLNLTPGADTMYILSRSVAQGKRAGVLSALGISTGSLIHCLFAAFGLSVILAKSAIAFMLVKYIGAAYLFYLGIKMIRAKQKQELGVNKLAEEHNYRKIFTAGIFTNILNPKVALFFIAFLPQFIDPDYAHSPLPFILLGSVFLTTGTIWCLILALFASRLSNRIRKNHKIKSWLDKIAGSIFILIGIKLALSKGQ